MVSQKKKGVRRRCRISQIRRLYQGESLVSASDNVRRDLIIEGFPAECSVRRRKIFNVKRVS